MSTPEQPTTDGPPPPRRKSRLADTDAPPWIVPAQPPAGLAATLPAPSTAPSDAGPRVRADARTNPSRGHARDRAEAKGRKLASDAAFAWAAAQVRASERYDDLCREFDAATARGTDAELLAGFVREACAKYGVEPPTFG